MLMTKLLKMPHSPHQLQTGRRGFPERRRRLGTIWLCVTVSLLLCGLSVPAESFSVSHPNGIEVQTTPGPVSNGHTVLLEVNTRNMIAPIVGIMAWHGEKAIPVYPHPLKGPGIFIGFIGISYYQKPERGNVKLEWTNRSGYHFLLIPIEITQGRFKKEKLRVPKSKVSPSKADRRRITDERYKIKNIYKTPHHSRLWNTAFAMPATGKVTSPFGSQRVLNGKLKSYHSGVDFRASTGTPIYAANDGIVRFASNLFYSGNHLIIDHGLGLFTGYSHLSEFRVESGQMVHKGQEIGLAGSTGRSNGPHLHWGAKVNGISVDPLQLTALIEAVFSPAETDRVTESE